MTSPSRKKTARVRPGRLTRAAVVPPAYARTVIPNGATVLTERVPGVRSVSAGVWIRAGGAHESPDLLGISHLLEHMVFKGSERRSARDFALELESRGGALDAYTSREHTAYTARVLDTDLDVALDVLADLVLNPRLRADDLALEREVVLEEIAQVDDTPDDLVFELHGERLWGDHPYGRPILGTRDTVAALTSEHLRALHDRAYVPANMVIAAAGNVEHDAFVERVAELFPPHPAPAGKGGRMAEAIEAPPEPTPAGTRIPRDTAQTHIVTACATPGHADPLRHAMILVSNALGGGMSSRLFQRIREELGLSYTVYAFQSFYRLAGVAGAYLGTRPEWAERAADVLREEFRKLAAEGLTAEELEDGRNQLKGSLLLSLESTSARLQRLAGAELYDEPWLSPDELAAKIDAVGADDAARAGAVAFDPDRQVLLQLGPARGPA
ncbi:MAG TPA: pitrilysin family protein [Longimicrobiales bacterium]|nr:pitrilysin family protein [Longimicrobiales bacterium]